MCLECSGRHRALGVHVSFVRSVSMDSWTEKQIKMMDNGGNDKCNTFLAQYNVSSATHSIQQKYNSPAACLYRDRYISLLAAWLRV
jgi:ADP-ribosylation factor GTPase-activating protein 1